METKTGNEEAQIEKAAELGQITEEEKVDLLGGLSMGIEAPAGETAAVEPEAGAAPATEEILIGGRTFTNEADAIAYARELEEQRTASDAYRQGVQDTASTQQGNPPPPQTSIEDADADFNAKYYENPKTYLDEVEKKATNAGYKKAIEEIDKRDAQRDLWTDFYQQNPELKNKDKLVKAILAENMNTLGKMTDHQAAMKILARKTKDQIKSWLDEEKPKEELSNAGIGASPGSQSQVTRKKAEEKPLDFISQVRKAQEDRMASS